MLQKVGTIVEVWSWVQASHFLTFTQKCYNEVITRPELLRKYKNFRWVPCAKCLRIRFDVVSVHRPTANQHSLSFPNWSVWFLWRICYCASMCHASCCTDECDMDGKTFVDLGSGVGQVLWWHPLCVALWQHSRSLDFDNWQVCMMFAALSSASRCVVLIQTKDLRFHPTVINCSCFGIELMDNPAHYAVELVSRSANCVTTRLFMKLQSRISLILLTPCIRFQSSATENGVSHAPIQLLHGDFLKNSAVKDAISTAGLVYINNFKFGPDLNLRILGVNVINFIY